jgi:hypothetical protein
MTGHALEGRIAVMNGVFPAAELQSEFFVLSGSVDWHALVPQPADLIA